MGRRIESGAVARRLEYGGKRMGCRTLAVGATNMYRAELPVRIAECTGQTTRSVKPRLIGRSTLPLIHRQLCVEEVERLLVGHSHIVNRFLCKVNQ